MLMFSGLAGLDRPAGRRHAGAGGGAHAGRLHRPDARLCRCSPSSCVMWFAPKIATVHRRADAAGAAPRLRRHRALPRQRRDRDGVLPAAVADHVGLPHAVPGRPAVRPRHRLDRPGARRPRRPRGRSRCASCGRTRCLGVAALALLAVTASGGPASYVRCCSPAALRCRSRSPSSPRWPRLGTALARIGIGRLPEETAPPRALAALALPALPRRADAA